AHIQEICWPWTTGGFPEFQEPVKNQSSSGRKIVGVAAIGIGAEIHAAIPGLAFDLEFGQQETLECRLQRPGEAHVLDMHARPLRPLHCQFPFTDPHRRCLYYCSRYGLILADGGPPSYTDYC